jgi:type III secretion system YscI/HrpB-like protein
MDMISPVLLAAEPVTGSMPAASPVQPVPAEAANTAYFSSLMSAPSVSEPAATASVAASVQTTNMPSPVHGQTLGDTVLQGMQKVSTDMQHSWATVGQVLDGKSSLSVSDLLKVQMELIQTSLQFDFLGKVVGRTTQNVDQLVKLQ